MSVISKRRLALSSYMSNAMTLQVTINDKQIENVHNVHIGLRSKIE
jgi:hypothetical protein